MCRESTYGSASVLRLAFGPVPGRELGRCGAGRRPWGGLDWLAMSPARKRPEKKAPTPPEQDVVEKQDPDHTEDEFLCDLERATTNDSKRKLAKAARRG